MKNALLLFIACVFLYFVSKLLPFPWTFGFFAAAKRSYAVHHQVLFLLFAASLIFLWFHQRRHTHQSIVKTVVIGAAIGYIASVVAYFLSSSFFHPALGVRVGDMSLYGLRLFLEYPIRNLAYLLLMGVFLIEGPFYSVLMMLFLSKFQSENKKNENHSRKS